MLKPKYADLLHQMFFCGDLPFCLKTKIDNSVEELYEFWNKQKEADPTLEDITVQIPAEGKSFSVRYVFVEKSAKHKEPEPWVLHIHI